ncbi:hypothetical protein GCM10009837_06680 [Streptomyces durmitorensis]|uniref:Uncharacterized protein n=1 Tax=Streptomyces durmitorensis TaxID=319947 RepID=A0ABY4PL45_9ACTN|nr:hypothetical protein [Streptomyces durmitorensis]UQT54436.1 hypothetical protein M4V62_04640 [Streptomyces durmitorensis]
MTITTTPTKAEIADVLDKAIDVIDRVGWHRGYLYDEEQAEEGKALRDCPVCALGSISVAICGSPTLGAGDRDIHEAVALADAAAVAVARHVGVPPVPRQVAYWNDELQRTADDVRNAFRDTAAELRAGATA